jgi:predicted lipoprotein
VDTAREFDFTGMLANYADNLLLPQYRAFAERAGQMADDGGPLAAYCDAIDSEMEVQARSDARAQWRATMAVWQEAELMRVGPLAANGAALRNRIYAFGSTAPFSSCAVDQGVVLAQEADFDLAVRSVNSRGLAALEYLLFNDNLAHTCPAQISQTQDWNESSESERKLWRCDYARAVAGDIHAAADELVEVWEPEGGDYRFQWINPVNQEENLKALSDAIFYVELETKDLKLGVPTGIHTGCSAAACPESVESKYSETSLDHIRANLVAFKRVFNGGNGLGFDDIIVSEGFPDSAQTFNTLVDNVLAQIDAMDTSLYAETQALLASGDIQGCQNSAANPESTQTVEACSLHGLLKRITDRLRTDFVTIVDLDLPQRGQSDND